MIKAAVINEVTNIVENIIVLPKSQDWKPPVGYYLEVSEQASIGAVFVNGVFVREESSEDANILSKRHELISRLDGTLLKIKRAELEPGQHPSGVTYLEFYTAQYHALRAELKSL